MKGLYDLYQQLHDLYQQHLCKDQLARQFFIDASNELNKHLEKLNLVANDGIAALEHFKKQISKFKLKKVKKVSVVHIAELIMV